LRQAEALDCEIKKLETALWELMNSPRYQELAERLLEIPGVGMITAMVFLTELGDLNRFQNRRQLAAYLGLVPSSHESGTQSDRKGHITRQGPARVRKVLCQAVWSRLRHCSEEQARHRRIAGGRPSGKKKATVACMRQLGIRMWRRCLPSSPPSRSAMFALHATSAPARQKGTVPIAFPLASAPVG
jgi:transposase